LIDGWMDGWMDGCLTSSEQFFSYIQDEKGKGKSNYNMTTTSPTTALTSHSTTIIHCPFFCIGHLDIVS